MNKRLLLIIFLLIASGMPAPAQQQVPFQGNRTVTVMTQNLYSGVDAEIFAVPSAASFPDLLARVAAVYEGYFARDFPARAARIAVEVASTQPDLIGCKKLSSCGLKTN